MRWTEKLRRELFNRFRAPVAEVQAAENFEPVVNYDAIGKPESVTVGVRRGAIFQGSLGPTPGEEDVEIRVPWSRLEFVPNRADKRRQARGAEARRFRNMVRNDRARLMRKTFRGITTQDQADTLSEIGLSR